MTDKEIYRLAKKRVKAKKNLFAHIGFYIISIGILFLVNYFLINTHRPWFLIPAAFWGIGIVIHSAVVFFPKIMTEESSWEEKEMEKEILKLKKLREKKSEAFMSDYDDISQDDELDLKEIQQLRKDWDEQDLV